MRRVCAIATRVTYWVQISEDYSEFPCRLQSIQTTGASAKSATRMYIDIRPEPISTRKKWSSKLTSAFNKFSKKAAQEDQSVDKRPPTTGLVQLGVPRIQVDCRLLNLPVEVRQTIYKYVFGPSLIHVESLGHRLAHVRCTKWESDDSWDGHAHWKSLPTGGIGMIGVDNSDDPNDQLISLCLACRRM
jgi:hypothetical protein